LIWIYFLTGATTWVDVELATVSSLSLPALLLLPYPFKAIFFSYADLLNLIILLTFFSDAEDSIYPSFTASICELTSAEHLPSLLTL
jgi:hypothetical protein